MLLRRILSRSIVSTLLLLTGCATESIAPNPTEEIFLGLPMGVPIELGHSIRTNLLSTMESAPVGTPMTFFLTENQESLGSITIPAGSPAYRKRLIKEQLTKVFERLDPELSGGSKEIDLISIPATIRKFRKSKLKPRVILIGSPLIKDREQGLSLSATQMPCEGSVTNPETSYGKMETFPEDTTISWLTTRADYGNGPNHRAQVEHFLRYLIQEKQAQFLRISSDAEAVFNNPQSQWDDSVTPLDECTGLKKVDQDQAKTVLFDEDGETEIVEIKPDLTIKVRQPELEFLEESSGRVLFLPDTSASVAFDAQGNSQPEVFEKIKADVCQKIDQMPFEEFAICGFGGQEDLSPRLSKYPSSIISNLHWAQATRENRDQAIEFVKELKAGGGTPTLAALQEAVSLNGPMTCLLYSDGIPTLGEGGQGAVLKLGQTLTVQKIKVHCVGVGGLSVHNEDFDWSGGEFLTRLAQSTSGEYFALE
ncbi:hypothetical protein Pla110_24720 [Polystyrenella longa]|uniref:VWFA domain-containing protein n=1 Tax=Polystyrenella longa TaxID=2528007 RepID=A0A518CNE5_9PLAN|nr:vWA domain-containing protein [Polystyrenella longa]QDU80739.1 hypothetical protein Pla110_24720 [Polystyrenella longa]